MYPEGTFKGDILVKDGLISAIIRTGESKYIEANRILDVAGKHVLPGVIDAHMHVEAPFQGCFGANDFYTQSVSAAFGE